MIGIILVSHSRKITDGLKEMIEEMTGHDPAIDIISAGGTFDGGLGSDTANLLQILEDHSDYEQFYLFADIGSAVMSVEQALEFTDTSISQKALYIDAPLVEGAFVAAVKCMVDPSVASVSAAVQALYQNHS